MAEAARAAIARQGHASSTPAAERGADSYRAFAAPMAGRSRGAVVILVDLESGFDGLRLVSADPSSKLILVAPGGRLVWPTVPELASTAASADANRLLTGMLDA